jgi:hypothetical protein
MQGLTGGEQRIMHVTATSTALYRAQKFESRHIDMLKHSELRLPPCEVIPARSDGHVLVSANSHAVKALQLPHNLVKQKLLFGYLNARLTELSCVLDANLPPQG